MNVITISREYGAGGGEVGRALAARLGWELLDRELLHEAAAIEHVPDAEIERLDEQAVSLADRFRLHPPHAQYIHGLTEAVRRAADRGRVVLIGRGTRQLVGDRPGALHLLLVAPLEWRAARMADLEGWTTEQATARCAEVDRQRDRFTHYFFGKDAFDSAGYDLVVNTAQVPLKDVTDVVAQAVQGFPTGPPTASDTARVLTLSRQLGAGGTDFVPELAARLKLRVVDREVIEAEAVRLGVTPAQAEAVDERHSGIFERYRPGSLSQRYFPALRSILGELTASGNVLIVGRAGNYFLRADARAFHLRLVALLPRRVRRVMAVRWVRESVARKEIAASDAERQQFFADCGGQDWGDPLGYHLTVSAGRIGEEAGKLAVLFAELHWLRTG